jgi:hypothetical protein
MSETLDLTAEEFANWLVERAPERLWGVDGEVQIEMARSLPCTGTELAAELKRRGGRLRLSGPPDAHAEPHRDLGRLSPVAYGKGDEIIFRAAWLNDGNKGREWFIETDLLAEEATRSAHAS